MKKIVTKFGGSSLADAGQFRKVKDILLLDEARQYVIPSAPGRRFKDDGFALPLPQAEVGGRGLSGYV